MAMVHHDAREYAVAVSDAAKSFQKKLEEQIHSSVERVEKVIEQVENDVPEDAIVAGKKLQFTITPDKVLCVGHDSDHSTLRSIHKHALGQLADRPKISHFRTFVNEMNGRGEWGKELIAHNLNEVYSHMNGDRFLLRTVRGELRGFLSDQYRRLDSRPLLDAFIGVVRKFGARPVDGFALQTKMRVRAMLPYVFEPFPGEIMAFGAELGDSDFGDGALTLSGIVQRMWCTNLAVTEDVLCKVHLGKRLDDIRLSAHTYELDTKAMASAVNDLSQHVLGAPAINGYLDMVKVANEQKIEPSQITGWVKKNLNKDEGKKAVEKFNSPDVELLPAGQTKWRWSNALSWLANETTDERRKLELQEFAGAAIAPEKKQAA